MFSWNVCQNHIFLKFNQINRQFFLRDFISAGSDDGSFFIWDKKLVLKKNKNFKYFHLVVEIKRTTNVVRVLKGDESIVNCLAPHPFTSILASSGIDSGNFIKFYACTNEI